MAINPISIMSVHGNGPVDKAAAAKTEKLLGANFLDKPVTETDQVNLTPSSLRLREIETGDAEGQPPMDQEKIEKLRNAIAKGEYQVDSGRIANKMLEFDGLALV